MTLRFLSRSCLCAAAVLAIAGAALGQDAATVTDLFNRTNSLEAEATAEVQAALKDDAAGNNAGACAKLATARSKHDDARAAMASMKTALQNGQGVPADTVQAGLKWIADNKQTFDGNTQVIERGWQTACVAPAPSRSGADYDAMIDKAAALGMKAHNENGDAAEAFKRDDINQACKLMEVARQDHSDSYQAFARIRDLIASDSSIPSSAARQYLDGIDNVQSQAESLAASMAELWRNRCSWLQNH